MKELLLANNLGGGGGGEIGSRLPKKLRHKWLPAPAACSVSVEERTSLGAVVA